MENVGGQYQCEECRKGNRCCRILEDEKKTKRIRNIKWNVYLNAFIAMQWTRGRKNKRSKCDRFVCIKWWYFSQDYRLARFRCSRISCGFPKFNFNCSLGESCVYLGPIAYITTNNSFVTILCGIISVYYWFSNENDIARWMNTSSNLMLCCARWPTKNVEREAARERQEHPHEYAINFHINASKYRINFEPVLFLFVSNLFNFRLFFFLLKCVFSRFVRKLLSVRDSLFFTRFVNLLMIQAIFYQINTNAMYRWVLEFVHCSRTQCMLKMHLIQLTGWCLHFRKQFHVDPIDRINNNSVSSVQLRATTKRIHHLSLVFFRFFSHFFFQRRCCTPFRIGVRVNVNYYWEICSFDRVNEFFIVLFSLA